MPEHILTDEELACLEGCRSYPQYYQMRKNFEARVCTFCKLDRELNEVLFEDAYAYAWVVPEQYKRGELAYHALFVPKRHVRFETDLTTLEVLSLHEAKRVLHARFNYTGGCTHVREGTMRLNTGTVPHLHYNTFMPNRTGAVTISVFKSFEDQKKSVERAAGFAALYEAGERP